MRNREARGDMRLTRLSGAVVIRAHCEISGSVGVKRRGGEGGGRWGGSGSGGGGGGRGGGGGWGPPTPILMLPDDAPFCPNGTQVERCRAQRGPVVQSQNTPERDGYHGRRSLFVSETRKASDQCPGTFIAGKAPVRQHCSMMSGDKGFHQLPFGEDKKKKREFEFGGGEGGRALHLQIRLAPMGVHSQCCSLWINRHREAKRATECSAGTLA